MNFEWGKISSARIKMNIKEKNIKFVKIYNPWCSK